MDLALHAAGSPGSRRSRCNGTVLRSPRVTILRDPVHGDIKLTREELRLVDTVEFQRLRGIKQLGSACLVYPGAVHTRHTTVATSCASTMMQSVSNALAGAVPVAARLSRLLPPMMSPPTSGRLKEIGAVSARCR